MAANEVERWLREHEPAEVREATNRMLRGEPVVAVASPLVETPPENTLIEWLRDTTLQAEYRDAVLSGCKDVLAQCHVALVTDDGSLDTETFVRLCRVVDVAAPDELYDAVTDLLVLVLRTPNVCADVVTAAVRGAMRYHLTQEDLPLWEDVARRPESAAYGFNAVLQIAPRSKRVCRLLVELWLHQLVDGWNVDMPFLVRRAARKREDEELPLRVVKEVEIKLKERVDLQGKLRGKLAERAWSREWLPPSLEELIDMVESLSAISNEQRRGILSRLRAGELAADAMESDAFATREVAVVAVQLAEHLPAIKDKELILWGFCSRLLASELILTSAGRHELYGRASADNPSEPEKTYTFLSEQLAKSGSRSITTSDSTPE